MLSTPVARRMLARLRRRDVEASRRAVHLVVCGGTTEEWMARSDVEWQEFAIAIGEAAASQGLGSVTFFPVASSSVAAVHPGARHWVVRGVSLSATCEPDGRRRIAEVVDGWPAGQALTEETLGRALTGDSGDPDVVAVIDSPGRLPAALVWELAYAEIVDVRGPWSEFGADDVSAVMREFRTRHRRFGGLGDADTDG